MAIVRQGILGGFRGRVGNVVGTGWKGIAVMKSLPLSVANPRTAGQVMQRNKFSQLVSIGSLLLASWVKPLWDRFASGMSGFNAFISANQTAFSAGGTLDVEKLVMSQGRMIKPDVSAATVSGSTLTVTLKNPIGDKFALPTDRIYIFWGNPMSGRVAFVGQATNPRGSQATVQVQVTTTANIAGVEVNDIFAAYQRVDGSEVSNSVYYSL